MKRLEFDGQTAPAAWPSVSLCMIVKNEEQDLAACLESVGDFAGEIIIVDTGSTDRTVEIARAFGAQVKHFTWIDDFAAARNESIREASGEWIFWMDADDRLSPDNLNRLKQALVSGQAEVYQCRVVSPAASGNGVNATGLHFRLFRNHVGLWFQYPLHEDLKLSAAQPAVSVAHTNITITHTGYNVSQEALQAKARRNLAIIETCLAADLHNRRWQHHRAVALSLLGEFQEAAKMYEAAIAQPPSNLSWEVDVYQAHISLVAAYVNLNRLQLAQLALQRALNLFPQRRHLAIVAGMFYLDQDQPEQALAEFERAQELPADSDEVGYTWQPGVLENYLSQTYLRLGRWREAHQAGQKKMLSGSKFASSGGSHAAATQAWEPAPLQKLDLLTQGDVDINPQTLRLLAQVERQQQHWHAALDYWSQALTLAKPEPEDWLELAVLTLLKTGQSYSAKLLCRRVLAEQPQNRAARCLWQSLTAHPDGFWAMLTGLVRALLTSSSHSPAEQQLKQSAQVLGLTPTELLRLHGLRLISAGDHLPAAEVFSLIISQNAADASTYKSFAVALKGLGREEDAVIAWQVARSLERVS
ncbi:MAG: glycosyltransferase [Anaerolineae bacterium]